MGHGERWEPTHSERFHAPSDARLIARRCHADPRAPRIYNFPTNAAGALIDRGQAVVETDNAECVDANGTCWETSGIIDASAWFGSGAWLFDVQAHTLPVPSQNLTSEGGQLLLLRLPGS